MYYAHELTKLAAALIVMVRGVPDGTGPYGRGNGPGQGSKSGIGLIIAKAMRGEKLTPEEVELLKSIKG